MSGNIIGREQFNKHYLSLDETGQFQDTITTEYSNLERNYEPMEAYKLLQFLKQHELLLFVQAYMDYAEEPEIATRIKVLSVIRDYVSNSIDKYPPTLDSDVTARTRLAERIITHKDVKPLIVGGHISVRQVATYLEQNLKDGVYPSWMTRPKTEQELYQELRDLAGTTYRIQSEDGLLDVIPNGPGRATTVRNDREGLQYALDWLKDQFKQAEEE